MRMQKINKRFLKKYYKKNQQVVLGVAAVLVVLAGLGIYSVSNDTHRLSGFLQGRVLGDMWDGGGNDLPTNLPTANVSLRTDYPEGSSVSIKIVDFNHSEPQWEDCGPGCTKRATNFADVTINTENIPGDTRVFRDWVPGGTNINAKCPCGGSRTCNFDVTQSDVEDQQSSGTDYSVYDCMARYDKLATVKVTNYVASQSLYDPQPTEDIGTITGSGFSCIGRTGLDVCSLTKVFGETVTLTAQADEGFEFVNWSPGFVSGKNCPCNGSTNSTCSFSVPNEDTVECNAWYQDVENTSVRVQVDPRGLVNAVFGQIAETCTPDNPCEVFRPVGTNVQLSAVPDAGDEFWYWGGNNCPCDKNNSQCSFTTQGLPPGNQHKCIATFREEPSPTPAPTSSAVPAPTSSTTPAPTKTPTPSSGPSGTPGFPR